MMVWNNVSYIVIDDFYDNPDSVREFALSQEFRDTPGYPGMRTGASGGLHNPILKKYFESIFNTSIDNNHWNNQGFGGFQLNGVEDTPWVHDDSENGVIFSALIYLNKDFPDYECGTNFYFHRRSGKKSCIGIDYNLDLYDDINNTQRCLDNYKTAWVKYDKVEYRYNRMVIFNSKLFHRVANYFGSNNIHDMRLMQVFFLNIENVETKK